MPIYEFYSPDTHKIYSFLARTLIDATTIPRCPDGDQHHMQRAVSQFAFLKKASATGQPGDDNMSAEDLRMEAALGQLEQEFRGIDEDNPDPRQLGSVMRRMQDLTGQQLPKPMQEMMSRLEAGEDPDALEEIFGEELADDMGVYAEDRHESAASRLKRILREARRREPSKDPQLYELKDWL